MSGGGFRKYGGIQKSATNNIVRSNNSNSANPTISGLLGQDNTKIISLSNIDMSGNSLFNIDTLYFTNGATIQADPTWTANSYGIYNTNFANVGIGTTTPNYSLDVSGNINFTGNLTKNGTPFTTSQWTTDGTSIYYNAGAVKIGASTATTATTVIKNTPTFIQSPGPPNKTPLTGLVTINSPQWTSSSTTTDLDCLSLSLQSAGISDTDWDAASNFIIGHTTNDELGSNLKINMSYLGNFNPTDLTWNYYYPTVLYLQSNSIESGTVGINTTGPDPLYALDVNGNVNFTGNIYQDGSPFTTSSQWITTVNDIYYNKGNVGIGTMSPATTLQVDGVVTATTFQSTSDYRLKQNIEQLKITPEFTVDNLKPIKYDLINHEEVKHDMGFLAHEVQEHFPFLVHGEKDGESMQSINYNGFIALLVKEIQELKKRVNLLEGK